jgi:dipeptidyl aminopeptidase/acylaminoacyl peptidase
MKDNLVSRIPCNHFLLTMSLFCLLPGGSLQAQQGYQKPPKAVADVLDAPPFPQAVVSPARDRLLLVQGERYPAIAELAEPMLRLAGLRINPQTHGPARAPHFIAISVVDLGDGTTRAVKVPDKARLGFPSWSPDGKQFVFTQTTPTGIELWIGDAATGATRHVPGLKLQTAYGEAAQWLPDGQTLLCQSVVADRGPPPAAPAVPPGPVIQESYGRSGPVRTYQDMLRNTHDEKLFDYYAASQLVLVHLATQAVTPLGKPDLFRTSEPAPDGKHFLIVRTHRPYSYVHPANVFPHDVEIWDRSGQRVHLLASLPLADRVPIDGVPTGPRNYRWRPTEPATLVWVEALDGGDPKAKVPHRDQVLMLSAPFAGKPRVLARTQQRFAGLTWGEREGLALLRDFDRERRWNRTFLLYADKPDQQPRLVWDRSMQDRYRDPGTPVMKPLPNGQRVLWQQDNALFLTGQGATPKGDRPFLDRLDLATLQTERVFQSDAKSYESVVALLSPDGNRFLTHHESPSEPPNYFVRSAGETGRKALTHIPDPTPQLRGIKKQLVTYKRPDGVQLSFTLYLPPDYQPGRRLPTVVWAYPREFNDPGTAGQVVGSPSRFTTITGPSHLFFLLQGYAILDGAAMPVVGDVETVNNTFLEQIVSSARAAIDKAVEMGVTDRNRVGVGGHSYGAFMTANLLAHSDLFRAGIARSGAYNRTLTPFGFQSESRTLWQAPDMYIKVSPFLAADKIKAALLLIHGQADNNPGTFPVQSERMYQAVRGNGGTVRYVQLPYESHGYVARESVEHTLYEMLTWFDRFVKNAPESGTTTTGGR